jgi:cytochrome bd ubiquinol oxidase subunit I
MSEALLWHRIQFAFTITFHSMFPRLTMGLALFVVAFNLHIPRSLITS